MLSGSPLIPSEIITNTLRNSANQLESMLASRSNQGIQAKQADTGFWRRRDDIAHSMLKTINLNASMSFPEHTLTAIASENRPYIARAMEVIGTSVSDRSGMSKMAFELLHAAIFLNPSDTRTLLHYGDAALIYIDETKHNNRKELDKILPEVLQRMLDGIEKCLEITADDLSQPENKKINFKNSAERAHYLWALTNFSKLCLEIARQEHVSGSNSGDIFLNYIENTSKIIFNLLDTEDDIKKLSRFVANDADMIGLKLTNRLNNFVGALNAAGLCRFYRGEYEDARAYYSLAVKADPASAYSENLLRSTDNLKTNKKVDPVSKKIRIEPDTIAELPDPFENIVLPDRQEIAKLLPSSLRNEGLVDELCAFAGLKKALLCSQKTHAESWVKLMITYTATAWNDWETHTSEAGITKLIAQIKLLQLCETKFPALKRSCAEARDTLSEILSSASTCTADMDNKKLSQLNKIINDFSL